MKPEKDRILVTGASGFLGSHLVRGLSKKHALSGTYLKHENGIPPCDAVRLDISDSNRVREHLRHRDHGVIIHAAAMTRPDECDRNREAALRTNVEGTVNLAETANEKGALFIYISTDLVFDGEQGGYSEADPVSPCNYYGETKLKAEEAVSKICDEWIILRPALMYGWGNGVSRSFIDWLDGNLRAGKESGLFLDQFRSFLYVQDVALAVQVILEQGIQNRIIHVGGPDRISRYDFGEKFVKIFGYSHDLIRPIMMKDLPNYAQRGKDCSFRIERLEALGFRPRTAMEGLSAMMKEKQA